jgi:hypothetical protein
MNSNYKAPHYAIFSILLLLPLKYKYYFILTKTADLDISKQ